MKKKYYIVKNDDTVIYGIETNKPYEVVGYDEKGNYLVVNNSGETIAIHHTRATLVKEKE